MSLIANRPDGSYWIFFIVGSETDNLKTTVSVTATGAYVNGDPGATSPLAAFVPIADANGNIQYSEGLSAMGYVYPFAMSFVGAQGGEFVGSTGRRKD